MKRFALLVLAICMLLNLMTVVFAAEESLPDVKFSAEYVDSEAYFKLTVEVTVNNYKGDAWVRVGAFKDDVLQKLVLNEKIDTSSLAHSKTVKYDVIVETEKPQDYEFKCFTFEENMKPLLPVSVITGECLASPGTIELKGIVTENSYTNIYSSKHIDLTAPLMVGITITDNCGTDNVDFAPEIDSESGAVVGYTHSGRFLAEDNYVGNYIGSAVIFEVVKDEESNQYKIVSIRDDEDKFDLKSFTLDRFDYASNNTISYYANPSDAQSTKLTLDDNVSVVYNGVGGQYLTDILSDESNCGKITSGGKSKQSGRVILINNDNIAGYDVVFVEAAATAVVKSVLGGVIAFTKEVVLPDNMGVITELETDNKAVVIRKGNQFIDYTELKKGDILSVIAESDNAGYILADVVNNSITGVVSSTYTSSTSEGNVGYVIYSKKYDVALDAYNALGLEVGEGGTFYINGYGKIVAFEDVASLSGNYGFVTKAVVTNDETDGKVVTVQMLTVNGVEAFKLATSVYYKTAYSTSRTIKPENAVVTFPATETSPETDADTFFGTSLKGQVVKFEKNSDNRIISITLANYDEEFEKAYSNGGYYDEYENYSKIGTTYIDSDSLIFFVNYNSPDNPDSGFDTENCATGTVADLVDGVEYIIYNNTVYYDSNATDYNIIVVEGVDAEAEEDNVPAWEGYGFVTKAIVKNDAINGKSVIMKILSENGEIDAWELASSVTYNTAGSTSATIKPKDAVVTLPATETSPETDADTFFGTSLKGQVIKYTRNSEDKISEIVLADYDEKFESAGVTAGLKIYDAENGKLDSTYIDNDSTIFFFDSDGQFLALGAVDAEKCVVGTVDDLEDKASYEVLAIYRDNKAINNNIIVIKGGAHYISPTTGVAVITGVAVSEVNGDPIYSLVYTMDGEEFEASTVAFTDLTTNYDAPGSIESIGSVHVPTVGDVVKIKLNSTGAISGLSYIWNFSSAVRRAASAVTFEADYDITSAATTNVGSLIAGEYFDAGYATAYKETSEQITLNSGNTYKLLQADNVYVIDASGRNLTVKNGSSASYKYLENLYSTTNAATVKVNGTAVASNLIKGTDAWTSAVATYTDYVFVRLYDGRVKDVVIVKNISDVSVSVGAELVTVSFDVTAFPGTTAPADMVILYGGTITLPDAVTGATGWSTDGTAANAVTNATIYTASTVLKAY